MKSIRLKPLKDSVKATIVVPGSKSFTNRGLLIAAMTPGTVVIRQPLFSDDTEAMIDCLRTLGIKIVKARHSIKVIGSIADISVKDYLLFANLSGTTMRFMLALSTIIPGQQTLSGGEGLLKRPIGDMVDALCQLGAKIDYLEETGYPPVRVRSSKLTTGSVKIRGDASSQFLSALLMIAPQVGELSIDTVGQVISKPYIDMTLFVMKLFGIHIERRAYRKFYIADRQQYQSHDFVVEGDVSSASYFFAIAALTRSEITVDNLNPTSCQADMGFLNILKQFGNIVNYGASSITVTGKAVQAVTVNMENCPDQALTMAVLAACVPGKTIIRGIQSLRVKETERIIALEQELAKMNITTTSTPSSLTIYGGDPHGATIETYGDHRMAMSFAIAGMSVPGIIIKDIDVVKKTFPDFWQQLDKLYQAPLLPKKNIVLVGMRGSGKTTIAGLLAAKLQRQFIDTDSLVVQQSGQEINEIVRQHGWKYFRELESDAIRQMKERKNSVIATGGGVVLQSKNINILKHNSVIIWLSAQPETLISRIAETTDRPRLTSLKSEAAEIIQLAHARQQSYAAAADFTVKTDGKRPDEIIESIANLLGDAEL